MHTLTAPSDSAEGPMQAIQIGNMLAGRADPAAHQASATTRCRSVLRHWRATPGARFSSCSRPRVRAMLPGTPRGSAVSLPLADAAYPAVLRGRVAGAGLVAAGAAGAAAMGAGRWAIDRLRVHTSLHTATAEPPRAQPPGEPTTVTRARHRQHPHQDRTLVSGSFGSRPVRRTRRCARAGWEPTRSRWTISPASLSTIAPISSPWRTGRTGSMRRRSPGRAASRCGQSHRGTSARLPSRVRPPRHRGSGEHRDRRSARHEPARRDVTGPPLAAVRTEAPVGAPRGCLMKGNRRNES